MRQLDQVAIASFMGSALGISLFLVGIFGSEKSGTPLDRSRLICKTWGLRFLGIRVTCPGDAKAAAKAEEKRLGRGLGWAKITSNDTLIVYFCGTYSEV
jgi:hypothetical protein